MERRHEFRTTRILNDIAINFKMMVVRELERSRDVYFKDNPEEFLRYKEIYRKLSETSDEDTRARLQVELHSTDYYELIGIALEKEQKVLEHLRIIKRNLLIRAEVQSNN